MEITDNLSDMKIPSSGKQDLRFPPVLKPANGAKLVTGQARQALLSAWVPGTVCSMFNNTSCDQRHCQLVRSQRSVP